MPISRPLDLGELTRRELLQGASLALGLIALPLGLASADRHRYPLPAPTGMELGKSPFVYISPLKSDGSESSCHGEVWFTFDRGDVVIATGSDTWKSQALGKGLDQARIWAGDVGPVGRAGERFRSLPSFQASAVRDQDAAAFERLLADFAHKYPSEWDKWEPRFRKSYADGSRIAIRYQPTGA